MRRVMLFLAVFGLAGLLYAADPFVGTWKLNISKSKFSSAKHSMLDLTAPRQQTETYREIGTDRIELTWQNVAADGSSSLLLLTYPTQGGSVKVERGETQFAWVETKISPHEYYATYLYEGKQIMTRHKVVSKDGKFLRQTLAGIDDTGKPFEVLLVLEKQ